MLARHARIYIYHLAEKLKVQVKGSGSLRASKSSRSQDELKPDEFGNAIGAPLGVHWGARESRGWRYWFYGADYTLADQLGYLTGLPKVSEDHLRRMIEGKEIPQECAQQACRADAPKYFLSKPGQFRILDYVRASRQVGRNWVARCPSCAAAGHDKSGDNLAIAVDEPRKYRCWAGCTKEMIRAALGRPIPARRFRMNKTQSQSMQSSLAVGPERRRMESKPQAAGVFCQPDVSVQYQTIAKRGSSSTIIVRRSVLRGVESGGANKDIGRYVTFCGDRGEPISWLQPIDSVATNGRHAVVILVTDKPRKRRFIHSL